MTDYDNTNSGALFRNDRKTNDRQPTHTGTLNVEGKEYWISAWVKEGKKGKFFSLDLSPKEEQDDKQRQENFRDFDEDDKPL